MVFALIKQLYQYSELIDVQEYQKMGHLIFQNWIKSHIPFDRFLEPMRRTILYPFIWKLSCFNIYIMLLFQLLASLSIPLAIYRLVNLFNFHTKQFQIAMYVMITFPLQFYYTGFLMPDLLSQVFLIWMMVFYFEGKYKWVPLFLTLLILLKPVFITFSLFPFFLFLLKSYRLTIFDILPLITILLICSFNFYQYRIFLYSSITTTNPYDYNRKMLLKETLTDDQVDSVYAFENNELVGMYPNLAKQKSTMDSLVAQSILNQLKPYLFLHIKGSLITLIDPGRYDAMVFLNWNKSAGLMGVNDGNPNKNKSIFEYIYIVFFLLLQMAKLIFVFLGVYHLKRYQIVIKSFIVIVFLSFLAGPVGCARYLLPTYPLFAYLASLGFVCLLRKFPKIEYFINK